MLDATRDVLRRDETDGLALEVFELKHLMALGDRAVLPVLLYLFRRIEQRLDGRPTLILVDEAWQALMHSTFGAKIAQWLYALRKQNAAVVLATQSPAQFHRLHNRSTILESCATKIWLPNADALSTASRASYHECGLANREIALLAHATPKRHYYLTNPRGNRVFDLGLHDMALSIMSVARSTAM
jgi:type IV secretion system protein VirB4